MEKNSEQILALTYTVTLPQYQEYNLAVMQKQFAKNRKKMR